MCLALPGKIIEITQRDKDGDPLVGRVSFGSFVKEVTLFFVPEAVVGDWVTVHVDGALAIIDEEKAEATIDAFNSLAEYGGLS